MIGLKNILTEPKIKQPETLKEFADWISCRYAGLPNNANVYHGIRHDIKVFVEYKYNINSFNKEFKQELEEFLLKLCEPIV